MKWILLLIVVTVGMLQPVQAGMNAEFRRHALHPLQAGGLNMVFGAVVVSLVLVALRVPLPTPAMFAAAPWWSLLGGAIGGTIVVTMLIAAPKLGAALLISSFVLGQLISSAIIDQHGLIGYPQRSITGTRAIGMVLMVVAVILIERGGRG